MHPLRQNQSLEMLQAIENCIECHQLCLSAITQGLKLESRMEASHLRLLMDCAQICQTAADFMQRGSPLHYLTCRACAEVCSQCADACSRSRDPLIQRCAAACREAATTCREMAGSNL